MTSTINRLEDKIENLEKEVERIKKLYDKTLFYRAMDPEVSLSQARKSAEAICKQIYIKNHLEDKGKPANKLMLNELIQVLNRNDLLPEFILINLNTVQSFGNFGVHDQGFESEEITEEYVKPCLLALGTVFNWYVKTYYEIHEDSLKDLICEKEEEKNHEEVKTEVSSKAQHSGIQPQSSGSKVIRVVGNHAPPYRIFSKEGTTGIYFDVMRAVAQYANIKIEIIEKPFKRALQMMKSGEADIMVGPIKTAELEEYMSYFKLMLPAEKKAFYVNQHSDPIINFEDLYKKIVIIGRGKFYYERIHTNPKISIVEVTEYLSGIKMVNDSPNYVIIIPEKEGDYLMEENNIDLLTSPFFIEGKPSYICFSKQSKNNDAIEKIESGLEYIIENGIYDNILKMY